MKALVLSLLILLTCGSGKVNGVVSQEDYENVSLASLIANPEKYHNKSIRVKGYVKFENEGEAIYLNKNDFEYYVFKNAVSLIITDSLIIKNEIDYGAKGYAIVKGVFNKNRLGRNNSFSGSINNIEYIDFIEKRE